MTRQRLDVLHQARITAYMLRNPTVAKSEAVEWVKNYVEAPRTATQAIRTHIASVIVGQPVNEFWHKVLTEWAESLPDPTLPPPPRHAQAPSAAQAIVRWLPGEVERRIIPDMGPVWRASEICPRLGMAPDHASKHKGTLDDEDYRVSREGPRQVMWVTKRGVLKLIMRSRDAGVKGTFLNALFNRALDVLVEITDSGFVVSGKNRAEEPFELEDRLRVAETELEQARALNRDLEYKVRTLIPPPMPRLEAPAGTGPPTEPDN